MFCKSCYKLFLIFLSFFFASFVFAQKEVSFKHLTADLGLVHNHINCSFRDINNYMWFGTESGLSRFDGVQFVNFRFSSTDPNGLSSNMISGLFEGPNGDIWIKTNAKMNVFVQKKGTITSHIDSVLNTMAVPIKAVDKIVKLGSTDFAILYNDNSFVIYNSGSKTYKTIGSNSILDIIATQNNSFTTISKQGIVQQYYIKNLKLLKQFAISSFPQSVLYGLMEDSDGDIWVSSKDIPIGVYWIRVKDGTIRHIDKKLSNVFVGSVIEYQKGLIWLGTDHGGINVFNKANHDVEVITHKPFNQRSLPYNSITSLYKDPTGIIWVGTYKGGISYHHPHLLQFPVYSNFAGLSTSLPFDDVNKFVEDRKGNLWIGTNGGGLLYYDFKTNNYKQYTHQQGNSRSISSDVIVSLYLDRFDVLWIGTYHGGLCRFDGKEFKSYLKGSQEGSLKDENVWEFLEDSQGRFWVGTLANGLFLFDKQKEVFKTYYSNTGKSILGTYVSVIFEDSKKNIWVGTATGVEKITKDGSIIHFSQDEGKLRLSNNLIYDIKEDKYGRIWIATQEGITIIDGNNVQYLKEKDGLVDNAILTLVLDDKGNFWCSSVKGISEITFASNNDLFIIRNFTKEQGLQSSVFNENAALRLNDGRLIFGGPKGFNIINPNLILGNNEVVLPVLSTLYLANKPIQVDEVVDGKVLYSEALNTLKELNLSYNQNALALELSSFDYLLQDNRLFQYQLEGLSDEWFDFEKGTLKATFTNLSPKSYKFYIRYSLDNKNWSPKELILTINIAPPFWFSTWFIVLYIVLFAVAIYVWQSWVKLRTKTRNQLVLANEQAIQSKELDEIKTRFFTNVSHEFRTPISLILTPVEELILKENDPSKRKDLELISKNALRLLNLVNQLLNFRKLEKSNLVLKNEYGDLIVFFKDLIMPFYGFAQSQNMVLVSSFNKEEFYCFFDKNKMESIFLNLLSNAIKFNADGGRVIVDIVIESLGSTEANLQITIGDEGPGIPQDILPNLFERYFQYDVQNGKINHGTGIGLSIVKEFITFLNGNVGVESEEGKGTKFNVSMPLLISENTRINQDKTTTNKSKILLVEDNIEFLNYLSNKLREEFYIEPAFSVVEAKQVLNKENIDLVITDINLPNESGIELCSYLTKSDKFKHIPVIVLTAVVDERIQLEALKAGASDYIQKPFNMEMFKSKISSVLGQRSSIAKKYKKQVDVNLQQPIVASADEKFISDLVLEIERDLNDSSLSVETLATRMHMTRVGLYKKVLAITGYSPMEYIRHIRLKRAMHLIQNSKLSIAEVAYEVGFGNPKQFSKYFKSTFGYLPSYCRK